MSYQPRRLRRGGDGLPRSDGARPLPDADHAAGALELARRETHLVHHRPSVGARQRHLGSGRRGLGGSRGRAQRAAAVPQALQAAVRDRQRQRRGVTKVRRVPAGGGQARGRRGVAHRGHSEDAVGAPAVRAGAVLPGHEQVRHGAVGPGVRVAPAGGLDRAALLPRLPELHGREAGPGRPGRGARMLAQLFGHREGAPALHRGTKWRDRTRNGEVRAQLRDEDEAGGESEVEAPAFVVRFARQLFAEESRELRAVQRAASPPRDARRGAGDHAAPDQEQARRLPAGHPPGGPAPEARRDEPRDRGDVQRPARTRRGMPRRAVRRVPEEGARARVARGARARPRAVSRRQVPRGGRLLRRRDRRERVLRARLVPRTRALPRARPALLQGDQRLHRRAEARAVVRGSALRPRARLHPPPGAPVRQPRRPAQPALEHPGDHEVLAGAAGAEAPDGHLHRRELPAERVRGVRRKRRHRVDG